MATKTINLKANETWRRTGIYVQPDDDIRIRQVDLSQKWSCNPRTTQSGGHGDYDARGHATEIAKAGYAMPGAPEGALVARVGQSLFLVGVDGKLGTNQGQPVAELELTCNDDVDGRFGKGYSDNTGAIDVEITFPAGVHP